MGALQNSQLTSGYTGCMLLTVLAENVATGVTAVFTLKPAVPDKGLNFDMATLSDREAEKGAWNYCDGRVGGLLPGADGYSEKTLDFTVSDDFAQAVVEVSPVLTQSTIENMVMGGVIVTGNTADDRWNIIGTQGVKNAGVLDNDNDTQWFLYEDGKTINPNLKMIDGSGYATSDNFFVDRRTPACMFESKYAATTSNVKGTRMAYVIGNSTNFQEGSGTDSNKVAISGKRECEVTYIDKYLAEGLSFTQAMETSGTDEISRVNCDMIITVAGGGTPTVAGVAGDQVAVVNSTDGSVEMYLYGADWDTVPVTSVLAKGAKLFALQVDTALDGVTAVTKNAYISVKTAGATGSAVAVDWKTKISGSGTTTYILEIFDWDYGVGNFVNLAGNV